MQMKKNSFMPVPITQHSLADLKEIAMHKGDKSKNQRKDKEGKKNKSSIHTNMKKSSWISKLHKQIFNVSSSYLSKQRNSIKSSIRSSSLSQFDKENNEIRNNENSKDRVTSKDYYPSILLQSNQVNLKNIKEVQVNPKYRNKNQFGIKYGRGSVDLSSLKQSYESEQIHKDMSCCQKNNLKRNRGQYSSDQEWGGSLAENNIKKKILKLFQTNIIPFLVDKFVEVEQRLKFNVRSLQQTVRKQNKQIIVLKQNQKVIMGALLSDRQKSKRNKGTVQQNNWMIHNQMSKPIGKTPDPPSKIFEKQIEQISISIQKIIGKFDDQSEKIGNKLKQMTEYIERNKLQVKSNFETMEDQFGEKVLDLINTYNENFVDLDNRIQRIQTTLPSVSKLKQV